MKNYVEENTGILTSKGVVPISTLEIEEDLFNKKPDIFIVRNGELFKTNNYDIYCHEFNNTYYVYKNNYNKINCSKSINFENLTNSVDVLEEIDYNKIFSFYLNDTWYKDKTKDCVIALSLFISNLFTENNGVITRKNKVSKNYIYRVLKYFNKKYKIFFPYNKITQEYEFKTNLFKKQDNLIQILLSNTNIFKNVLKILEDIDGTNYSYKALYFDNYCIAATIMSLISLSNYTAKLIFDKNKSMFKVTYVSNNKFNCANKNSIKTQNYVNKLEMYCIELNDCFGSIILNYCNNNIHNTCILEANSKYF